MRVYKGCFIERTGYGWSAMVRLSYGWMPTVRADTLAGVRRAITDLLEDHGLTKALDY